MWSRVLACVAAAVAVLGVVGSGSSAPLAPLPAEMAYTDEPPPSSSLSGPPEAPYLIDRGGNKRRLFRDAFALAWSPDGSRLAANTAGRLVILRPGHPATLLPLAGNIDFRFAWTPDGRRIVYPRGLRIFIADSDGRHERLLARNALVGLEQGPFSLSPDGLRLVYAGHTGLFIVRTDGSSAPSRIPLRGFPRRDLLWSPAWSPDGRWIAFNVWAAPFGVYVVRPNGSSQQRLVAGGFGEVWSPDSTRVAFLGFHGGRNGVVRVDGSRRWTLPGCTCELRGPGFWPSLNWSPDGSRIAYISDRGMTISSVRPDGTGAAAILQTSPSRPWRPLWRPR